MNPDAYRLVGLEAPPRASLTELLKTGGGAAVADLVGRQLTEGLGAGAKSLAITPTADAPEILQAMRATGVEPKLTDVTASRLPAVLERGAVQTLTGQAEITGAIERQAGALTRAADEFTARLGAAGAGSAVTTGERVRAAVQRNVAATRSEENRLFTVVGTLAERQMVDSTAIKQAAAQVLGEQGQRLRGQQSRRLLSLVNEIVNGPDQIPWAQARAWQRGFGEAIERGELISHTPSGEAKLLFRAISGDMERAVAASGNTQLEQAFTTARRFSEHRRELFRDSAVAGIMDMAPEDVVKKIGVTGGPTAIRTAREAILNPGAGPDPRNAEAWNYVRRHILEGIFAPAAQGGVTTAVRGLATPVIEGRALTRALGKLGDETLAELLSPTERAGLENIRLVANAFRSAERIGSAAQSTTFQNIQAGTLFSAPGAAVGYALGGIPGASVGSAVSMLLAPPVIARILTNPRTAEIVASPAFAKVATGLRLGGRLGGEATTALTRALGILVAQSGPIEAQPRQSPDLQELLR